MVFNDDQAPRNANGLGEEALGILVVMEHVGEDHYVKNAVVPGHSGAFICGYGNEFSFAPDALNALHADVRKGIHEGAAEMTEPAHPASSTRSPGFR